MIEQLYTIDQFRNLAIKRPRYMGLGTIKLVTRLGAYRFYCEDILLKTIDRHHTHTFTFRSDILKGTLRNIIYDIVPVEYDTNWQLTQGVCERGSRPRVIHENIEPTETLRFDTSAGDMYIIDSQVFHKVAFVTDKVITKLTPTEKSVIEPQFVLNRETEKEAGGYVDPWGESMEEHKCWEGIRYILAD